MSINVLVCAVTCIKHSSTYLLNASCNLILDHQESKRKNSQKDGLLLLSATKNASSPGSTTQKRENSWRDNLQSSLDIS